MFKKKCKKCGKVIEGYSPEHTKYLMLQHKLSHRGINLTKKDEKEYKKRKKKSKANLLGDN